MIRLLQTVPWLPPLAVVALLAFQPNADLGSVKPVPDAETRRVVAAATDGPRLLLYRPIRVQSAPAGRGGEVIADIETIAHFGKEDFTSGPSPSEIWMAMQQPREMNEKRRKSSWIDTGNDDEDPLAEAFGNTLDVELPKHEEGWGWLADEVLGQSRRSRVERAMSGDILVRERYNGFSSRDPLSDQIPSADSVLSYGQTIE